MAINSFFRLKLIFKNQKPQKNRTKKGFYIVSGMTHCDPMTRMRKMYFQQGDLNILNVRRTGLPNETFET